VALTVYCWSLCLYPVSYRNEFGEEMTSVTYLSTESGTILFNGLPKDAPLMLSAYLPARMVTLMLSSSGLEFSSFPF
jgi:hypothetical protein